MYKLVNKILLFLPLFITALLFGDEEVRSINNLGIFWLAPIGSLIALLFAMLFYVSMKKKDEGLDIMKKIASHVREGAGAYLMQQYKIVAIFFIVVSLLFVWLAFVLKVQSKFVPFAFLTGGFFSGLCGFLGMKTATYASARTANAARQSLNSGLQVAFRSGAVMGLIVVGFGLFDVSMWFLILNNFVPFITKTLSSNGQSVTLSLHSITTTMLCFGMGASSQALFARVGGGIYTKAADVGADLVGKVEAGIPEDDPRNPATIADNVGDNVGDVAGMGADLYESYAGSILAAAALAVAAGLGLKGVITPMVIAGVGVIASIIGVFLVKSKEDASQKKLMAALNIGIWGSSSIIVIAAFFIIKYLLPDNFGVFWSMISGLIAGLIIGKATEYYTSDEYKPTQNLSKQALTGPATVIIDGVAVGMMSTMVPVITISLAILFSYGFAGGFSDASMGLFGVALAAVGMLSTLGITLATDAYGPIADNAGGNAEMSNLPAEVRERTDALDSLGNTTAATGKGFAIGSAALTAMALVAAYIEEIRAALIRMVEHSANGAQSAINNIYSFLPALKSKVVESTATGISEIEAFKSIIEKAQVVDFMNWYNITLLNPQVIVGAFIGSMMSFFFCALTMKAVGRAAGGIIVEVRRQFKEIKGLLEGTADADYASCVAISTKSAQKEMILPSLLAIIMPVLVGLVLGVAGVVGLLIGGLTAGFVLAIFMANAGGAWDNAKKYIEKNGTYVDENGETKTLGGKGSEAHKAGVVGDTVGDPFKDTSGPSLNILIKLMSMVSVVFAGLIVSYSPVIGKLLGMIK